MRRLLLLFLFVPSVASAQLVTEMTPALVEEAIQQGLTQRRPRSVYEVGDYWYTTPYSRVVMAAELAKKHYKPFTAAEVTPEMLAPELEVVIPPDVSSGYRSRFYSRAPSVTSATSVVIMPKGSKDVAEAIQPLTVDTSSERYQNLLGASWDGRTIVARFPLSALSDRHELRVRYADDDEERAGLKTKGVR